MRRVVPAGVLVVAASGSAGRVSACVKRFGSRLYAHHTRLEHDTTSLWRPVGQLRAHDNNAAGDDE